MPEFATKKRNPAPARRRSLAMHAGQCTICRHPLRTEIERAFLDWRGPRDIAREYGLGSHTTLYRHAHALGLFQHRERTLRFALGRLIEQVGDVRPTAASIVSAIRLMAKLNARGESVEEIDSSESPSLPDISPAKAIEDDASGDAAPGKIREAASPVRSPAAQALPPAPVQAVESASAAPRAKPTPVNGKPETKKQDAKDDYHGPPIAFAQSAGPRRKFFWR
jgi:hypothetical protein